MKNLFLSLALFGSFSSSAQSTDDYTRYELLDPATHSFQILYEVSATRPGAVYYHNTLRKGSEHRVDRVIDLTTGHPLTWTIVNAGEAKKNGLDSVNQQTEYLQIKLVHAIPINSEYRLLIDKTYKDAQSYFTKGDQVIFQRTLGIKRNAVVLPIGYELIGCNYPSQVAMEADGRIKISFVNRGSTGIPLRIVGRKLAKKFSVPVTLDQQETGMGEGRDKSKARTGFLFPERAHQTREIVYFLQQPETNSFRLYHDYTETREGINKYVNVVRAGSKASHPSAINLDTGMPLKVETLVGDAIKQKGIDIGTDFTATAEAVVIWFDPVVKGASTRIRIEETYTDPNRYLTVNQELVWDRSFGRVHNTVVLPAGWWLTANAIPATVFLNDEGLVSLYYLNDGPDDIDVYIKALKKF